MGERGGVWIGLYEGERGSVDRVMWERVDRVI